MSPSTETRTRCRSYSNLFSGEADEGACRQPLYPASSFSTRTLPLPGKSKKVPKNCSGGPPTSSRSPTERYPTLGAPPPGPLHRAPSQVTMHYTTVPQSLVSRQLGSRHHPTRSSLRHSRLLVLVRKGRVPRKYLPSVVERERVGVAFCLSQLCLGLALTGLAVWRVAAGGHITKAGDWPLYSGLLVIVSGWFGLTLILCCRYHYPGAAVPCCVFPVRSYQIIGCIMVSALAAVSTLVAAVGHLLHLVTYSVSVCQEATSPPTWPGQTCVCLSSSNLWEEGELVYPGASCSQVNTFLTPFLLSLVVMNVLSFLSCSALLLLLLASKHVRTFKYWRRREEEPVPKPATLSPMPASLSPRPSSLSPMLSKL